MDVVGPNNDQFHNFHQVRRAAGYGAIGRGCEFLTKALGRVKLDACIKVTLGLGGSVNNTCFVLIRVNGNMDTTTDTTTDIEITLAFAKRYLKDQI